MGRWWSLCGCDGGSVLRGRLGVRERYLDDPLGWNVDQEQAVDIKGEPVLKELTPGGWQRWIRCSLACLDLGNEAEAMASYDQVGAAGHLSGLTIDEHGPPGGDLTVVDLKALFYEENLCEFFAALCCALPATVVT